MQILAVIIMTVVVIVQIIDLVLRIKNDERF